MLGAAGSGVPQTAPIADFSGDSSYQVFPPGDRSEWGNASGMGPVVSPRRPVLVVVTSGEAHGVGAQVAQELRALRHDVTLARTGETWPAAHDFAAVIIGDSWWSRWHPGSAETYVRANHDVLASRPSGYFSIHSSTVDPESMGPHERFFRSVRWRPSCVLDIARGLGFRLLMSMSRALGAPASGPVAGRPLRAFASQFSTLIEMP